MPTLSPASRLDNIKPSIFVFFEANVETVMGLPVYYEQSLSLEHALPRWIEVYVLALSPQSQIKNEGFTKKIVRDQVLINVNLFEKRDALTTGNATLYSLDTLATDIKELLLTDVVIPIQDYKSSGNPSVGYLLSVQVPAVVRVQPADYQRVGISQINVSATMDYFASWTP